MTYQVRILLESEAMIKGGNELGNLLVNPFHGRTLDEVNDNLEYAKEWFKPTLLMSLGEDQTELLKEFKTE